MTFSFTRQDGKGVEPGGILVNKRIMIVAGEASGDLHGASLVKAAHAMDPSLSFFGIGGSRMRAAGVVTLTDAAEIAVVGLVEVIAHFPVIYRAFTGCPERFNIEGHAVPAYR